MRKWFKRTRIILLLTVIVVVLTLLGQVLGVVVLSGFEGIILAFLTFLVVDDYFERTDYLERILNFLEGKKRPQVVFDTDIENEIPLDNYLQGATELFVSGGSLPRLLSSNNLGIIKDWLREKHNAKLKLLLENPESARTGNTPTWSGNVDKDRKEEMRRERYANDIETSLKEIAGLMTAFNKEKEERVEVKVTPETPSVTVLMIDEYKMRIHINLYMGGPPKRPAFQLDRINHSDLFLLFHERYREDLWNAAETPVKAIPTIWERIKP